MKTMVVPEEQFVTDAKGRRTGVLLTLDTYERLREAEEELADIQAHDAALPKVLADIQAGDFITLAAYRAKRNGRRQ
jgi:PHD/YefM family antitoxin component YafN of YafNO toxin-antitoxin module